MSADLLNLNNLDLLIVGVVVAATCVLGFVVYFSNRKSITNKTFLFFSIVTALWGIITYFSYKFINPDIVLWLFRFTLFFAVFQAFFVYRLFMVFPLENYSFSKIHKHILIPIVILIALLTLSPFVLTGIIGKPVAGEVAVAGKGPALILFALIAIGLVIKAFYVLILKIKNSKIVAERKTFSIILSGLIIMFVLIIFFNLILTTAFSNPRFVPLGSIFTFPFIIFTSYAIFKQKLFNIKVAATAILVFLLSIILFFEVIFSDTLILIIFRSSAFFLVLVFGINLIRSVIKEVRQREKLESLSTQLSVANEKLKGLDKLKTEFVSLASHQLRSPLTAIKGYTSMLVGGDYGDINPEAKEAINRIMESSNNLTLVVEDLLNVTKIEQGGMKYEMEKFDFGELTRDTAKDLSIIAEKKWLKLLYNIPEDKKYNVNGDKEKLRQVIVNLIDNSIKYTKEGQIDIDLKLENGKVTLSIKDTGVGVSDGVKKKLFKKFSREDRADLNTSGSGLGLYLVKEIVDAHKGRAWVESEGLGKGSTFFVELNEEK
jgi:signal transduction histidine kinase